MKCQYHWFAVSIAILSCTFSSRAGFLDKLGSLVTNVVTNATSVSTTNSAAASAALNSLSSDQLIGGVKQALSNGLQHAVGQLGHEGGFLTNLNVKIQMPERLQLVEKTL